MIKKALRALALLSCLILCLTGTTLAAAHTMTLVSLKPADVLNKLMAGNERFVRGKMEHPHQSAERRWLTAQEGQRPFAVVLSCSDSRVPPELVFDAGVGDIFSVRDAGNVADKVAVGSIEYAVDHLGPTLIMVLGHTGCGAVGAAVSNVEVSGNIAAITDRIKPAVAKVMAEHKGITGEALAAESVKANVRQSIGDILSASPDLRRLAKTGKIKLVGALYDLEAGTVTILVP